MSASTFPKRQPTIRRRGSGLETFKVYLQQQWSLGYQQTKALFKDIQQQGYQGSYRTVARFTQQLRRLQPASKPDPQSLHDLPGRSPVPMTQTSPRKPLTARRSARLVLQREDTLTVEEKLLLERLAHQPELSAAINLAKGFIDLVRRRLLEQLDSWLETAISSSIKGFESFAQGIKEDYDAVKNGLSLDLSNGPVEGQNNRLKMLKRQMFGRAGLDLLTKRLILTI